MMTRRLCFLVLWVCILPQEARTQVDTILPLRNAEFEQAIEDLILHTETEEQLDYSYLTDALETWLVHPLDINKARREELLQLPGMNELYLGQLLNHIRKFGPLTSIYELQAVAGFPLEVCHMIRPYIMVNNSRARDLDPHKKHPAGPKADEIKRGLRFELIQRISWIVQEQRGYTTPDTSFRTLLDLDGKKTGTDTVLSNRYTGSPYRIYTRFSAQYSPNVSFSLVGEKDPGECFGWNPSSAYYGYDLLSSHIALKDFGRLKHLIVGDYNLQVGQGLVLSRGLGFGKGAQVISSVKMPDWGIVSSRSANENQYLRGIALTYALKDLYITGFFSRLSIDASMNTRDTLADEELVASSLRLGGLHRTKPEIAIRKSIPEVSWGGRIAYKTPTFTLGVTNYFQIFGSDLQPVINDYNIFGFSGKANYLTGLDFDWIKQNINLFGEVSRSRSGGIGFVAGMMGSLAPSVDMSFQLRHFARDFHSNRAYVFAERPSVANNETGVYLGLQIMPNTRWKLSSYFDQYYFPWNRFRASFPSHGWEFMSQLQYKPKRTLLVYLRFRSDNQQKNAAVYPPKQQIRYLIPTRKNQLRLHFQSDIHRNIRYKTRLEYTWFWAGTEQSSSGFLLYQDLTWRLGFKWRLSGRYALFDVGDFDSRIYAYENDILGFFSIPAYYGTGSRYYSILQYKLNESCEIWARVSQTQLQDARHIGTGLERIEGNSRTEVKLQVRVRL